VVHVGPVGEVLTGTRVHWLLRTERSAAAYLSVAQYRYAGKTEKEVAERLCVMYVNRLYAKAGRAEIRAIMCRPPEGRQVAQLPRDHWPRRGFPRYFPARTMTGSVRISRRFPDQMMRGVQMQVIVWPETGSGARMQQAE